MLKAVWNTKIVIRNEKSKGELFMFTLDREKALKSLITHTAVAHGWLMLALAPPDHLAVGFSMLNFLTIVQIVSLKFRCCDERVFG